MAAAISKVDMLTGGVVPFLPPQKKRLFYWENAIGKTLAHNRRREKNAPLTKNAPFSSAAAAAASPQKNEFQGMGGEIETGDGVKNLATFARCWSSRMG